MAAPLTRRDASKLLLELYDASHPEEQKMALAMITAAHLIGHRDSVPAIAKAGAIAQLVHLLKTSSQAKIKELEAAALACLAKHASLVGTVTTAGAIPPLLQLLGASSPPEVQQAAAVTLATVIQNTEHFSIVEIFTSAGGGPLLKRALGPGSPAGVQTNAATTLRYLAHNSESAVSIAAAGAIPLLV
ncbi:hypothetical protein FOA52_004993 [Chlamydomonas sp. UWO 241]|nr:hypothetical protein FOA52_004993 [Chlamydomonas sp. UWO 241]